MLTRNNFLPSADMETRRGAYLNALKIAKLLLTAVGFGHVKAVAEACQPNAEGNIPVSPLSRPPIGWSQVPSSIQPASSAACAMAILLASLEF
ncbi:probable ubiquitin carboxyl-terminal hydrolase FAF-X isoform X1 [Lates japonicus]|uniref:Probable ubiquitin carboxyl-terminal hydrolase FAF-X isoform X1 n=1 Tax=Lates japonicus TaxID=270547 RepID=A0AAD3N5L8_LATJO|nr:probable ubiquitin carboxyl-terminal hydrolase FAF-X isoform X1 [Lates japonicus]